jgi:Raf kinase inhibitor-like YbhB/YbcL family protein
MKFRMNNLLLAAGLVLASFGAAPMARSAEPFMLTSPAFADNAPLAVKNAGDAAGNPNCVGQSVSPPLSWANPPAGTTSFALLLTDPEGRGGLGVVHMVVYGIPASVTGFAEGELSKPSDKFVGGKSTMDKPVYFGPCTPPGDWHHYTFTLIATDLDPKALQPGMTRDELFVVLMGHAKGGAGLIGRFRHPS